MLDSYDSLVFDCDGVLFNSNKLKEDSLEKTLINIGFAESLVKSSIELNRGKNRKEHFYFCASQSPNIKRQYSDFNAKYSLEVQLAYSNCERFKSFSDLKLVMKKPWAVISSSDELELNILFKKLGIEKYFEYGIYGGPESKEVNYEKLSNKYDFRNPLYIGDGIVDIELCEKYKIDLLFLSGWTSLSGTKLDNVVATHRLSTLSDLL